MAIFVLRLGSILLLLAALASAGARPASAQEPAATFVVPPRTISDITAVLDQEKPDPAKRAKTEAAAAAEPPAGAGREVLARFYLNRARARADLGRVQDALADTQKAVENSSDYVKDGSRAEMFMENVLRSAGENRRAIALLQQTSRKLEGFQRTRGRQFTLLRRLVVNHLIVGDIAKAEGYVKRLQALLAEAKSWPSYAEFGNAWDSNVEAARGRVLEARGRYAEAEASFVRQGVLLAKVIEQGKAGDDQGVMAGWLETRDFNTAFLGRVKARLGRVVEGEADVRRALLSRLRAVGKYNPDTALIISILGFLLREQSRFEEADKLLRTNLEILEALGYAKTSVSYVNTLSQIAASQFSQRRYQEAKRLYKEIDAAVVDWEPERRSRIQHGWARTFTDYFTGNMDHGIQSAREFVEIERKRKGDKHTDTAMARAVLAAGLGYAKQDAEALAEFRAAMPILHSATHEDEEGDLSTLLSADRRLQSVTEANLLVLARAGEPASAAAESLTLADGIRSRAVQNALEASAARAAAKTPQLAEVARKSQDIDKQISALSGSINNLLAAAPEDRDEAALKELQKELDGLRAERVALRRDMQKRFPDYNSLVNPQPATIEDVRAALKPDEAFLAFYFGRRDSFAWAVPKSGPPMFVVLGTTSADMEKRVAALRTALEPNASTVGDIPAFDLKAAHELYALLLKPTEAAWKQARSLIVVTNGSLGLLPLGVLPTEAPKPGQTSGATEPLFADYRGVPWLARTHAVSMVPSASALRTLRLAKAPTGKRQAMIGFGDPLFSAEQAKEAAEEAKPVTAAIATRGLPLRLRSVPRTSTVDSAEISQLPRLPDTADELRSIAEALKANAAQILHLGREANEKKVKSLDLSNYRIVAFATHGLVPGEINGLTQPALALTAPSIADVDGDGLLTVDEILALKLNADWVVLSACNTGSAAAAGAEVASGLGRAFFYAGTRALLVTNWSVHSASARELVTDLFRRQQEGTASRAEALRQAAMALMDGPGFTDGGGKTLFTYAHPLFWAPYTLIGDGG